MSLLAADSSSYQPMFTGREDADDMTEKKSNRRGRQEYKRRTKFMLEGVRQELYDLQRENKALRLMVKEHIKPLNLAERILVESEAPPVDMFLMSSVLMDDEQQYAMSKVSEEETRNRHRREQKKIVEENRKEELVNRQKEHGIPKVLSVPHFVDVKAEVRGKIKAERRFSASFHSDTVDSLAVALSGDFAF